MYKLVVRTVMVLTLVLQTANPDALHEACVCIDAGDPLNFEFLCTHNTHRSVGCCIVMATIICCNATIMVMTPQTRRQARARDMI